MQTILGANGVIATGIAKELPRYTSDIRLVSRNPRRVNTTDEIVPADITDPGQVDAAVKGSEVVYLTAGLPYKTEVWQEQWPMVMENVVNACKRHGAKLVFFDNVYLYGRVDGWMKEDTPINPASKKGEIRARIARMLMDEVDKGEINALIARSADFYGKTPLSVACVLVFENYAKGRSAQIMIDDSRRHSYTYVPDAGKAAAILGNTPDAFNQVWHLPTDRNVLTVREFIEESARAFGVAPKYMVLKKWLLQVVGLFNPLVKESIEMLYQNELDYLFSSDKFDAAFDFKATPYSRGIAETAQLYKQSV